MLNQLRIKCKTDPISSTVYSMVVPHKLPKHTPRYILIICMEGVKKATKNLTRVCFPANILYRISQTGVTICPNLQRLKYIISHSVQISELQQFSQYSNQAVGGANKESWLNIRKVKDILLFSKMSVQALKPTQHPTQLIPEVKRPGRKADQSPPSSAEIKNEWSYVHTSPHSFKECTGETTLFCILY